MAEVRPGGSPFDMKKEHEARGNKKSSLPQSMYDLIRDMLSEFKFDGQRAADVAQYVLGADIDMALEDCVPMKVFFGMVGNKYEEKQDAVAEQIKILLEGGVQDSKVKVTTQKGRIKSTKRYSQLMAKKLHYARLRRDCRVLEAAMEMRRDTAQTRSANYRTGMAPGSYTNVR